MKASWEKIEKNTAVLDIEVEESKVAEALDKAFKKVVKKVNVPGFRKGKVPRQIFEKKFGIDVLYQDALDIILPEAYMEAVNETGIEPVGRPEVDVEQFAKGQTLKFKVTVTVKPEVKLGEYKGLEVPAGETVVTEEEIKEELERLQQRHAELEVAEEGAAAENGNITVIDFEGFVDGEAFEGGKAEKYTLELGSGSFIPGFEEQVVGMKKDEEKDIEATFPEDYHAEELKGKKAVFKVKLHDIKRKNLPELDDEFAKDISEFDTLEEYKKDLKQKLSEKKNQEQQAKREAAVVEKAAANAEVDIPAEMIEAEQDQMVQEFERRLGMQGMNLDLYFQFSGQNVDTLKEQMKEDAEKRVRNNLVLEAIAEQENITASDENVNAEIEKLAESYQRTAEEIRSIFEANGSLSSMKQDLAIRKTVDFLLENSKTEKAE
ncbi:trigger factor [Paenibacillus larvae]|uniref:Trigger factor n=3 Tax=Paenibacillus larvae TaxID=1464 RepID=V9WBZ9_9BACL|nr:trigger factor [Paenibacillus larvae]AHD06647.1 trigger factor Tig [Paenibacillus larvae subsp. larvae DSM 25430]AVF21288.1 trigger factor Tig [Paenibacillus larvae subsp. larvae]AVG13204.1 trigger factor Tig [Paenibacillus larvae subsp. larvae DSM 25430]MCY7476579.1 trigger factor [Paenibacillus larvae]MCY7491619.1 trigger factor [Paenibacillus larvae]